MFYLELSPVLHSGLFFLIVNIYIIFTERKLYICIFFFYHFNYYPVLEGSFNTALPHIRIFRSEGRVGKGMFSASVLWCIYSKFPNLKVLKQWIVISLSNYMTFVHSYRSMEFNCPWFVSLSTNPGCRLGVEIKEKRNSQFGSVNSFRAQDWVLDGKTNVWLHFSRWWGHGETTSWTELLIPKDYKRLENQGFSPPSSCIQNIVIPLKASLQVLIQSQ